MKRFLKTMLVTAGGLLGLQVQAQQVSIEEAQTKAMKFLNEPALVQTRGTSAPITSLELAYQSKSADKSLFYVFNNTSADGGFVIVGGDEAAQDILGYSEKGSFDYATLPANFKWWLSQYGVQIEEAIEEIKNGSATIAKKVATRAAKTNISYFLTTEWDQVAPYNSQIPLYAKGFTGQNALATGCVATAGAQIMKYYNWPESGVGSKTLSRTINNVPFSADFENTTYDWSNMQDKYSFYDTYTGSAADIAVGTLMYHIGVAVDMEYGQLNNGGSGAVTKNLAIRLADTFKYDRGIQYKSRKSYTDQDWEDMIYAELAVRRPVLYSGASGADGSGGHAFVCDGYEDGRYHINWGWSGSCNGYFLLTPTETERALVPNGTGSGGSAANSSYVYNQEVAINIKPDYDGSSIAAKSIAALNGYEMPADNISRGTRTYIEGLMYNTGMVEDIFSFAVKLVNETDPSDTHFVETSVDFTLSPNQGKGYIYFNVPEGVTPGCDYYVYPMYKNEKDEWVEVELPLNFDVPTIRISVPTGLEVFNVEMSNNNYVSPEHFNLSFDIKNWGNYAVSDQHFIVWIFPIAGGSSVDYIDLGTPSIDSKGTKHFDLTYSDLAYEVKYFESGKEYYLKVRNETTSSYLSNNYSFTFCDDLNVDYTLTDAGWGTLCLPFNAEVPNGLTVYNVSVVDGNILNKDEATKITMNTPYLVSGTPGGYHFSGPDTPTGSDYKTGVLVGNTASSIDAESIYAPMGSYVLQKQHDVVGFYKVAADNSQKIRQYSAYLSPLRNGTSYAASFLLGSSEVLGIQTPEDKSAEDAPTYNLNGIRVDNGAKGLVIVNGKLIYKK